MKAIYAAALLCLCFGVQVLMTAADDSAQRAAELQMKRRIINKFPAAEFGHPVQHMEKK